MRYLILKASTPSDTRFRTFETVEEFHKAWGGVVSEHKSELEAVTAVRWMFPDAVGFPAPVPITSVVSGKVIVMALVERMMNVDSQAEIPFVALVHAVSESDTESYLIRKNKHFDRRLWRLMPNRPASGVSYGVELRSNQIDLPIRPQTFLVGRDRGRLVIYVQDGEVENMFVFDDPHVHIGPTKPDVIPSDGTDRLTIDVQGPDAA